MSLIHLAMMPLLLYVRVCSWTVNRLTCSVRHRLPSLVPRMQIVHSTLQGAGDYKSQMTLTVCLHKKVITAR